MLHVLFIFALVIGYGLGWAMRWARHPCYGCFRCRRINPEAAADAEMIELYAEAAHQGHPDPEAYVRAHRRLDGPYRSPRSV